MKISIIFLAAVVFASACVGSSPSQSAATTTFAQQELSSKVLSYEIQADGSGLMKVEISRAGSGEAKKAAVIVQTYDSLGNDVWYLGFPPITIAGGEKKTVEHSVPASAAGKVKSWKIIKLYFES